MGKGDVASNASVRFPTKVYFVSTQFHSFRWRDTAARNSWPVFSQFPFCVKSNRIVVISELDHGWQFV